VPQVAWVPWWVPLSIPYRHPKINSQQYIARPTWWLFISIHVRGFGI